MFRPDEFTPERPSTIFNNIWGTVKRHEKILDQDISFSTRQTVMFVQRSVKDLIFSWSYRKSQKCFWYLKSYFSPQKWRMTEAVGRGWEVWQWRKEGIQFYSGDFNFIHYVARRNFCYLLFLKPGKNASLHHFTVVIRFNPIPSSIFSPYVRQRG